MLLLSLAGLLAPQVGSAALPPAPESAARKRPSLLTLEGTGGLAVAGLFDLRSGAFAPERLPDSLRGWTGLRAERIDFAGRTEATSGLADEPEYRADVGTGSRIVLPGGAGTLVLLSGTREAAGIPAAGFAILHIATDGAPRLLLDRDALPGGESPFCAKLGIDVASRSLLIGTKVVAGGDLLEVDLDTGEVIERTIQVPPLTFGTDGIWLGESWGFGIAPDGPYRFLRRPGAQASRVLIQATAQPTWRGDAAMNRTKQAAVAIAGSAPDRWQPYVIDAFGPARVASAGPQNISAAGFAPEISYGPFLALCDDGKTAAWRVEGVSALMEPFADLHLGRADPVPPTVVATGDDQMVDTVNEITRVIPSPAGGVLFAVGEPNDPTEGGIEGAEVMAAGMDPNGALTLENLSQTSTDTVMPLFRFVLPTWTPARVVFLGDDYALINDDDAKELVRIDLGTGARATVLDAVREVFWIEVAGPGGGWVAAIERDDAQRRRQIVGAASSMQAASVLDAGSPTVEYLTPVTHRASRAVAWIRRDLGAEFLDVADLNTFQRHRWSTTPSTFTPPLAFVGPKSLAFTRQAGAAGGEQRVWSFRGPGQDRAISGLVRPSLLLR